MSTLKHLLLDELADRHDAEKRIVIAISAPKPKVAKLQTVSRGIRPVGVGRAQSTATERTRN